MNNSVLWLELRIRIRERRLWVVTCLYLLCLFAISFISLMIAENEGVAGDPAQTGLTIFAFSAFSLLALLVIIGPLASAGSITQEREQRTLPALLNTPLTPSSIVLGKLLAAWAFLLWLASLSLPFFVLGVIWGAIDFGHFLASLGVAVAAGMVASAVAIGLSGYFRRTLTSYLGTGAVMFIWLIVWPIFGALCSALDHSAQGTAAHQKELFYIFYGHHVVTPLVSLLVPEMDSTYPPQIVVPFALGIWTLIGVAFFFLACRGVSRAVSRPGRT
jgi:ABC-type transport system involved in multi-copper enzyme maturation permease subunit